MKLNQLNELSADRPLLTPEIHQPNDFYGHAAILKKYAGFFPDYKVKAVIEHAPRLGADPWKPDLEALLPAIFVSAPYRFHFFRKFTKRDLYAIGPMISYTIGLLNHEEIESEKRRLGKNLLVFPAHSTHRVSVNFDTPKFCEHIELIGKDFDSVRICLYWKDVLRGWAEEYLKYGFECVTAGHMFDPLFLARLKSIIETATLTVSNDFGTHIGYSVILNKPHYYIPENVEISVENDRIFKADGCGFRQMSEIEEVKTAFAGFRSDISSKQREIVDKYWGVTSHKSVKELRELFEITDKMFEQGHYQEISRLNSYKPFINFDLIKSLMTKKNRKFAIFGAGMCGQSILSILQNLNQVYNYSNVMEFFLDNDPQKHHSCIMGKTVLKPQTDIIEEVDFIVVSSIWKDDIENQLLDMGVPEEKIIFGVN
ncbi:MAG: hypothetical protein CVU89_05080 [Firmicutes bacterium HGW-Firmicutes-14]|nr:MAG: hypothetical protein CVU89_05080 [Firmicutes bacterium HGW-Firmicutes-14]